MDSFSRFHYFDKEKTTSWDLIQNKNEVVQQQKINTQITWATVSQFCPVY